MLPAIAWIEQQHAISGAHFDPALLGLFFIFTCSCAGKSISGHFWLQACRLTQQDLVVFFACSSISLDIHCEKNISMADAGICCLQRLGSSELHSFLLAGTLCNAHNLLDCPDQNCSLGSACSLFQIMTQSDSDQNCSLRRMHFHVMRHVIPPSGLH